jgi:predicted tellurium resistance membrane protein TerC
MRRKISFFKCGAGGPLLVIFYYHSLILSVIGVVIVLNDFYTKNIYLEKTYPFSEMVLGCISIMDFFHFDSLPPYVNKA